MTYLKGTTRAQTIFLRGFAKNPYGPPPQEWPSPVVLRRWLKRPGFCGAMNSILRALRYQADFHLTAAAASGAHVLHGTVRGGDVAELRKKIEALTQLLRMSHIRHRFADPLPVPKPSTEDALLRFLRFVHPSGTVEEALRFIDAITVNQREPGEPGPGQRLWARTGHPFSPRWQEKSAWDRRDSTEGTDHGMDGEGGEDAAGGGYDGDDGDDDGDGSDDDR